MIRIHDRSISIMVLCCIALHLWWAVVVMLDDSGIGATAVSALHGWFGAILPAVLLTASALALSAIFLLQPWWIVLFLIPQEILLIFSGSGAVIAIWLSQFADGVVRPRGFIANDVALTILAAISHTVAIGAHARRWTRDDGS